MLKLLRQHVETVSRSITVLYKNIYWGLIPGAKCIPCTNYSIVRLTFCGKDIVQFHVIMLFAKHVHTTYWYLPILYSHAGITPRSSTSSLAGKRSSPTVASVPTSRPASQSSSRDSSCASALGAVLVLHPGPAAGISP